MAFTFDRLEAMYYRCTLTTRANFLYFQIYIDSYNALFDSDIQGKKFCYIIKTLNTNKNRTPATQKKLIDIFILTELLLAWLIFKHK